MGGDNDDRDIFVDQGNWTVLEFTGGKAFGVNVGKFLELQGTLKRYRIVCAASEIEDVLYLRDVPGKCLYLRFEAKHVAHQPRHLT